MIAISSYSTVIQYLDGLREYSELLVFSCIVNRHDASRTSAALTWHERDRMRGPGCNPDAASQLLSRLFIGIHILELSYANMGVHLAVRISDQVRRSVVGLFCNATIPLQTQTNNLVSRHRARPTITFLFLRRLHRVFPPFEIFLFPSADSKTMS